MILLSIYPKHVRSILKGVKRFEFRKISLKKSALKNRFIIVYETTPTNSIRLVLKTGKIKEDNIHNLWKNFGKYSGIPKEYFLNYYSSRHTRGIAIEIKKVFKLKRPISLLKIRKNYPQFAQPQNLYLINDEKYPLLYKKIIKQLPRVC